MHIAVFYQYYHNPDCAAAAKHYALLEHWAGQHEVTLVTSSKWRAWRLTQEFPWVPDGVRLVEVDVPYDNRMSPLQRVGAFARYGAKALRAGMGLNRPDVLFGTSTPLSAAWVTALLARRYRVPWVYEVRDLWPDFPIEMQAVPRVLHGPLRSLEAHLYRSAAHIIAFSPGMQEHIARQGYAGKTTLLYNGTDLERARSVEAADVEELRSRHALKGRRVLLYAGTFGRANAIPALLEAARLLADRTDHCFVFIGDGYHERDIREASERLPNVRLLPPQPRHAVFAWFHLADAALVSFLPLPVLGTNSPSKFFDSLACGTPVVVTNEGWMRDFVEREGCGWYASLDSAGAYAAHLRTVLDDPGLLARMGDRAAALAFRPDLQMMFDRAAQAGVYLDIFEQVTRKGLEVRS